MGWSEKAKAWVAHEAAIETSHAPALHALMAGAALRPGERVIDIGCGMGFSLVAAVAAVGPQGAVTGVDIAEPMVARARERLAAHRNVTAVVADAARHRFAAGEADAVISLFGVMFFEDPAAALGNVARALRPGGRMVLAAWGPGARNPWFGVRRKAAEAHFGPLPAVDPLAPGPMAFADVERVTGMLREAGLEPEAPLESTAPLTPPGDARETAETIMAIGSVGDLIDERGGGEADRAAILDRMTEGFAAFETSEGLRVPAHVLVHRARRPG